METGKVIVLLNGLETEVREGLSVMKTLDEVGIRIPRLCQLEYPGCRPTGKCRVCMIEVGGRMASACTTPVTEGMKINTNTDRVRNTRTGVVDLLFSEHKGDCHTCEMHGTCELLKLAREVNLREKKFATVTEECPLQTLPGFIRDPNLCLNCGRCVQVCKEIQTVGALTFENRGHKTTIALDERSCVNCGQCLHACPTAALRDNPVWVEKTREALADKTKHVVFQIAPAVRVALGEMFGMEKGENVIGKIYTAVRLLGFDMVGDTNFTADLTIMEEGFELIGRVKNSGVLPQFTSCCPGWIKFMETEYSDLLPHLSSCKSPQQMFGALAKTYYAKEKGINPGNIVSVSVMPCTAKAFEAERPEMNQGGFRDVDIVLTTREFARLIQEAGIELPRLPESEADSILGTYTGAAPIFGVTGGVMEAALRTAYEVLTGTTLANVEFTVLRGMEGVREATVMVGGLPVRVAIAHTLKSARILCEQIREGTSPYHFIEVMTCPGGCVGGGGQPRSFVMSLREKRASGLYKEDANLPKRKSHENKEVTELYKKFLGEPNGHVAHELLHTHYVSR